ncbi:transposase, partial [Macrococcus caseolyticus]
MFILNKQYDLDFRLKLIKEYKEVNIGYESLS